MPLKLLEFVPLFGAGGTERQVVNLAFALDTSRFDLHFGCLRRWGHFLDQIDARGIPVLDYGVRSFRNPSVLGAQLRLARDIRKHGISIVHTYNYYANVFAIPAARMAGARVVASIRDMGPYLSPIQRRAQRYACKFANKILVNATAIKEWLVADGYDPETIDVIPNGIDVDRFKTPARNGSLHNALGIPHDAPLVGVIGRLTPLKGIDTFLEAAAIVAARIPAARFVIVGDAFKPQGRDIVKDDTYQDELERLSASLGMQDRVFFTGFRADVEGVLAELSVSVQPSVSEGLSNTLLESMAAQVPVVATRVGGTAEALKDGENGLLVPPGDAGALAAAVIRLLEAPELASRLAQSARRSVSERFSIPRMVEDTSRYYETLNRDRN